MAKNKVKRWYVRRVAKFGIPTTHWGTVWAYRYGTALCEQQIAITNEGLKALELAKGKK